MLSKTQRIEKLEKMIKFIKNEPDESIFGERLKEIMEKRGLSQNKFAELLGVSHQSINFYVLSKRMPSFSVAIRMAILLDVDLLYLAGYTDQEKVGAQL